MLMHEKTCVIPNLISFGQIIRESPAQFENRIKPRVYVRRIAHSTMYKRATLCRATVGNVSGYRCMSDCRFRSREFDPGPVPYFRGD